MKKYNVLAKETAIKAGRFLKTAQAVRRDGTAALDLAYAACGRSDGFWELRLNPQNYEDFYYINIAWFWEIRDWKTHHIHPILTKVIIYFSI